MHSRRIISFILALSVSLLLLALPAAAAEDGGPSVLESEELDALLAPILEEYELTEENFSLGFLYTGSGESYYYNPDRFMTAASLFKLPLCMLVAEKVSSGELAQEDYLFGYPVSRIEERCLIASNNPIASSVLSGLYRESGDKTILTRFSGLDPESYPEGYTVEGSVSARFVLETLRTLFDEEERFPYIIDCLLEAQPEHYFRTTLEGKYDVAQKYGQYAGQLNAAGIIYTPTPVLLVVMTYCVPRNMELIGVLAETMADYSLTLDEKAARMEELQDILAAAEAAGRELLAGLERVLSPRA